MSVREHLKEMHTHAAELHAASAKHHKVMQKGFEKLAAQSEDDTRETYQGMADSHGEMCQRCMDKAEQHIASAKSLAVSNKAAGFADDGDRFDKIVPDEIRGIITQYPDVTAIPRTGSPPINKATNVPLEFAHLVRVPDGED